MQEKPKGENSDNDADGSPEDHCNEDLQPLTTNSYYYDDAHGYETYVALDDDSADEDDESSLSSS